MKKYGLILIFSVFTAFGLNAQETENNESYTPKAGTFGLSLVVNGLIDNIQFEPQKNVGGLPLFLGRYYIKDDLVLRGGFGLQLNSRTRSTADSVGNTLVEVDSSSSNYIISISGGIEKHLKATKRLDPYLYSQLELSFIGKFKEDIEEREISNAGTAKVERNIKADGGFGLGIVGGFGFNYFIARNFSIGSELGLAIQYANVGGTISDNQITTPVNGSSSSVFTKRESQLSVVEIDMMPEALIHLSFFF